MPPSLGLRQLTGVPAMSILRLVNYSDIEQYGNRTEDGALVEAAARLVPLLGPAIFEAIAHLAHTHRLTPAQVKVILQVSAHGQMAIGEIACSLSLSMAAVSEMVERLVEGGHLVRSSDPADRRRVLVTPTASSQAMLAELQDLRRSQVRHALAQLAPEERPGFVRSLQAFLAGLTTIQGAHPAPASPGSDS